jgi:Polysaccharide pyruvyl transferase
LNAVSVREASGIRILEELGIQNATQVLDPVFLMGSNYWKTNFVKPIKEKYIFVYDFDGNSNIKKTAIEMAKKENLKIFTVNDTLNYTSKKYINSGPDVFLSLVFNAKYVLTNSFHAVAFSLLFNKKFLVFNRNEAINTRMRDLLNSLDLGHLLVNKSTNFDEIEIDYKKVNEIIETKTLVSKSFLNNALN